MNDKTMEEFEAWADEKGFCLDQTFMSTDGAPENPYHDGDTKLAYEIWRASRSPGCYAREEEVEKPPKRAVVLTAEIGGDTWRDVSDALLAIADRIEREGPITTLISGGYTSGYVLTGVENPDQTGDKYRQQNAEYVRQLKAAKRA